MTSPSKRKTILPQSLWGNEKSLDEKGVKSADWSDEEHNAGRNIPLSPIQEDDDRTKCYPAKRHAGSIAMTRFGVPIKPSVAKVEFPKLVKSQVARYHRSYNIDQAGPGVIALKDVDTLPVFLLKERPKQNDRGFHTSLPITHKNLIGLRDIYEAQEKTFFVYDYEHLAISLGCVIGTVDFSEADIATICKELLEGLIYIHRTLNISHGSLDCSNILLTSTGEVKIANIGDSLLANKSNHSVDLKAIASIITSLANRANLLCESSQELISPSLSPPARSFLESVNIHSVNELLKTDFLHLANPGGSWSLKRHYFETLPMGVRIGSRISSTAELD